MAQREHHHHLPLQGRHHPPNGGKEAGAGVVEHFHAGQQADLFFLLDHGEEQEGVVSVWRWCKRDEVSFKRGVLEKKKVGKLR